MRAYVTDTHALLWHLLQSNRLSPNAASIFKNTDEGNGQIYIPTIVLVEIVYLSEKVKIPLNTINRVIDLLDAPAVNYQIAQLALPTVHALCRVPRQMIPDMPDRVITATAMELDLPLITKDTKIKKAGIVDVVW